MDRPHTLPGGRWVPWTLRSTPQTERTATHSHTIPAGAASGPLPDGLSVLGTWVLVVQSLPFQLRAVPCCHGSGNHPGGGLGGSADRAAQVLPFQYRTLFASSGSVCQAGLGSDGDADTTGPVTSRVGAA